MLMLKTSINEVYKLLTEAQDEIEEQKKKNMFDLTIIQAMKKNVAIEKTLLKKTYEARIASLEQKLND